MNYELSKNGFEIVNGIYSHEEVDNILDLLESKGITNKFGVREFLLDNPEIKECLFTKSLTELVSEISPHCNKTIKSIYFDKPPNRNWLVNWHQDVTINLFNKEEVAGYKNWRVQKERVTVQPDLALLEDIFTVRIHLDDCYEANGALRVMNQSHQQGIINMEDWMKIKEGEEIVCEVDKGDVVLMKPLTLHSSKRTENSKRRRIIHIEFSNKELPSGLIWKEKIDF